MARVFVSLGSNIDRESNIARARARLRECYGPLTESALYRSPALGFDGDDFYNMVVAFDTPDSPQRINAALRAIEDELLRVRGKDRFVSRTIDLDVLLYGDLVLADGRAEPAAPGDPRPRVRARAAGGDLRRPGAPGVGDADRAAVGALARRAPERHAAGVRSAGCARRRRPRSRR